MSDFKMKSPAELRQMSKAQLREYRTQLWLILHAEWSEMQRAAWRPILSAIERSNEGKAVLTLKVGGMVSAFVYVEFDAGDTMDDMTVRLTIDRRNGATPEIYSPMPEELMAYLTRLGIDPYGYHWRWEPV